MAASRTSVSRRGRSLRVSLAVGFLSVATAAVLLSMPGQSALRLSIAAVTALALSWAGLRMMWTEVLQTRHQSAADRATAAAAYRNLFSVRAAEHGEFTTAMTERLAQAHLALRELEGLLTQHETRAQRAESRLAEATGRVAALERTLAEVEADRAVGDLVAWDQQTGQKAARTSVEDLSGLKQA